MKKLFLFLTIAIVGCTINTTVESNTVAASDSTAMAASTDSLSVDSLAVDTSKVVDINKFH